MTPKDLEDLAALINERWPDVRLMMETTYIGKNDTRTIELLGDAYQPTFGGPYSPLLNYQTDESDQRNGGFIIWALDRLDELLVGRCVATIGEIGCMQHGGLIEFSAPTRAEACARALLEALRREKE